MRDCTSHLKAGLGCFTMHENHMAATWYGKDENHLHHLSAPIWLLPWGSRRPTEQRLTRCHVVAENLAISQFCVGERASSSTIPSSAQLLHVHLLGHVLCCRPIRRPFVVLLGQPIFHGV